MQFLGLKLTDLGTDRRARLWLAVSAAVLVALSPTGGTLATGSDYVASTPATVYETGPMGPQNMDYDATNKMFIAHPGWLNDKLIHYYKFRMYTPDTYPTQVTMTSPANIPTAPLYLLTTSGDLSGLVTSQKPILRYHTTDGEAYSDFVRIVWVTVNSSYVADTWRSYGDLVEAAETMTESNIYANVPVVPTGSKLQDPSGTGVAPINALMAWYKGVDVQTFVFETTDAGFAAHFNPLTRVGSAAAANSGFEIVVVPFVGAGKVSFAPIWHLNQYSTGVTPGVNQGGPAGTGQRNVIAVDRKDTGYSPLWQVFWVAKVPVNYSADQTSNAAQITDTNGFGVMVTPMYVNCPNVGPHGGGAANTNKAATFDVAELRTGQAVRIEGALVMDAGKTVKAFIGATEVATATTGMMGGYVLEVEGGDLAEGANSVVVKDAAGATLQTVTLTRAAAAPPPPGGFLPGFGAELAIVAALASALSIIARRSRRP